MRIDPGLTPADLQDAARGALQAAAAKARRLDRRWRVADGTPVFTVRGRYTTRGWTEWTQGFQCGIWILCGEGLDDRRLVERGRALTLARMLPHVTHTGVHDHGFNNVSTYGNLLRLHLERRFQVAPAEARGYAQALAVSGAVQAARWTPLPDGDGFVHSFNGPHSLFVDTLRTLRAPAAAHALDHHLMGEQDAHIDLLGRVIRHARTSARFLVYRGDTPSPYDVRGRTAHEAVFNTVSGQFRSRATQQGYSPFSTWTRGLAWAMLGFAEQLEFLRSRPSRELAAAAGEPARAILALFERTARDTCDHYIDGVTAADGIPYWDDGAPGLARLGDWRNRPAEPTNDHEPVDSSAAAIAAQGLLRLGRLLGGRAGRRYTQAGLTVAHTLLAPPYLDTSTHHEGLLLHSVYHRPNGWDYIPPGRRVPCGESSLWGDYHLVELAVLLQYMTVRRPWPTFWAGLTPSLTH